MESAVSERSISAVRASFRRLIHCSVSIDVKLPPLLTQLGWDVAVKGVKPSRFKLKRGKRVKVWLAATPGDRISPSTIAQEPQPPRIDANVEMNGIVVGGMTFPIDPK